jgi:hypothetical protein
MTYNIRVHPSKSILVAVVFYLLTGAGINLPARGDTTYFCKHRVVLDNQGKLLPWYSPGDKAYDYFLRSRWDFVISHVPRSPGSLYPQYYFHCAFKEQNGLLLPDTWMNDPGEKLPNWFESARLYYAYTGDSGVMKIVMDMTDYYLDHGLSPDNFAWPHFPYTATNAGDTVFLGFTSAGRFKKHEVQVDHAGEMGLTFLRMYQFNQDDKYLNAAINIADVLARHAIDANEKKSVWPYRITMDNGKVTASYGANWTGAYQLLADLAGSNSGNPALYRSAMEKARKFILDYPMKTGYWTDGHSDNNVRSNTYKSNLSASNTALFLFDNPGFDPEWKSHIPMLIKWTEDNFIDRCTPGEPVSMWGANIVGEQDSFLYKMDYQTARYGAECSRWYAVSGDENYREKALRSLNWVTYCSDSTGMAFESPVSKGILSWWSDSYGECPRMFYQAFAGMPELAPPGEDHILYSPGILRDVKYSCNKISYAVSSGEGSEYLRVSFKPLLITLNGNAIHENDSLLPGTFRLRSLGGGDYALTIRRSNAGNVVVSGKNAPPFASPETLMLSPQPAGWYSGDMHVHRNCGEVTSVVSESELVRMMQANNLSVISVLADMGNGEVKDRVADLPKVTGSDARESLPGRIVHWDAEWHFDPAGVTFENKAIGGHLVFLGLKEAHTIWNESPYKVIQWAKSQGALAGFCHMEYLSGKFPEKLDCCTPLDFPVEAALGTIDFLSEDVWLNDASIEAYYKLLNCGFRLAWTAGTDYPCNGGAPLGSLLTWVNLMGKPLSYSNWIDGIKQGRTVVTTVGNSEFLDFKVNKGHNPGDELFLEREDSIDAEVTWSAVGELSGRIELVMNGKVVDVLEGISGPGKPLVLKSRLDISSSSWLCARRMNEKGHQTHTSPVYITFRHQPVRASSSDALFFERWIDTLIERIRPGRTWNSYVSENYKDIESRYLKAKQIYALIAAEAENRDSNP